MTIFRNKKNKKEDAVVVIWLIPRNNKNNKTL